MLLKRVSLTVEGRTDPTLNKKNKSVIVSLLRHNVGRDQSISLHFCEGVVCSPMITLSFEVDPMSTSKERVRHLSCRDIRGKIDLMQD